MSESLFELEIEDLREVPRGLPLIVLLRSMTDISATVQSLEDHFWHTTEPEVLLSFKADMLLDYRARRPEMTFEKTKLTDYNPDQLLLSLCTDSLGKQFLLLSGFEPDYRWDRFIDALLLLIDKLQVSVTTWAHALPMPVPHTKPVNFTLSGTREAFIEEFSDWRPRTRFAASIVHVLEWRLTQLDEDVVGITMLLPHYLAANQYPKGLLAAISMISRVTGLIISTEELIARDEDFQTQILQQISENSEHQEMVQSLEERYERFKKIDRHAANDFLADLEDIPTAEELADQFEKFLAETDAAAETTQTMDADTDAVDRVVDASKTQDTQADTLEPGSQAHAADDSAEESCDTDMPKSGDEQ